MAGCELDKSCLKTLGSNSCRAKRPQCAIDAGRPEIAIEDWTRTRVTGIVTSQGSQRAARRGDVEPIGV